jgi:hypothetical protein
MMQSESARATSAAEARFRIDYPNSQPRAVKVIALDGASERVVKRIAQAPWRRATFLTSLESAPAGDKAWSMSAWLADLAGRTKNLIDEIDSADLIVMVAAAGGSPQAASVIGEAAQLKKVMTTALIVDAKAASDEALSRTLGCLRPYASMLVVADGEDYIEAMLSALRA